MALKGLDIRVDSVSLDKHTGDIVIKFNPLRIPLRDILKLSEEEEIELIDDSEERIKMCVSRLIASYMKNDALDPAATRSMAKILGISPKTLEKITCEQLKNMKDVSSLDLETETPARVDGE